MPFCLEGRKVKLATGRKSQTVNVYVDNNVESIYDPKLRIMGSENFITEDFLIQQNFSSVKEMTEFLVTHCGAKNEGATKAFSKPIDHKRINQNWVARIIPAVEEGINSFVREFIDFPYLHRVEHSIHCQLYQHLIQSELLKLTIDFGKFVTQAVHKEWPEIIPRSSKSGCGNFDLTIIGPPASDEQTVDIDTFCKGFIEPAAVIEVSLNYDIEHLSGDTEKLINSKIKHGYLVHLARPDGKSQAGVEKYVRMLIEGEKDGGPRIAYASIGLAGTKWRYLREPDITSKTHSWAI